MTNRKLTALGLLGLVLCAVSVAVARADPVAAGADFYVAVSVLTIAALLGVGLYAWYRGGEGRFGQVLFVTGLCWFFVTFANSNAPPSTASAASPAGCSRCCSPTRCSPIRPAGWRAAGRGWWWSAARS